MWQISQYLCIHEVMMVINLKFFWAIVLLTNFRHIYCRSSSGYKYLKHTDDRVGTASWKYHTQDF